MLAICLFYRFVLQVNLGQVSSRNKTGAFNLKRKLGTGIQDGGTKPEDWPKDKHTKKVEGLIQASGEAEYVNDLPPYPGQLYGALVLAEKAVVEIENIDPSEALALDGVEAFYSAKDIPGRNSIMMDLISPFFGFVKEEIFSSKKVLYAGQPVGVIVADSYELALQAALKVKIQYSHVSKPTLTVKDVLANNEESRIKLVTSTRGERKNDSKGNYSISGDIELGSQYHFTLEPQSCICVPIEDGLNIFSSTQWMQNIQATVADALNIPENCINMQVRRLGGAFGCKISKSAAVANACALAAYKLNKPVRMILNIETNMEAIGRRFPSYSQYDTSFDESGRIVTCKIKTYEDNGCNANDPYDILVEGGIRNCYETKHWDIDIYNVFTDTPSGAWMRAPGTLEGILVTEQIMEHIATVLGKNPIDVRLRNFGDYPLMTKIFTLLRESSDYDKRAKEIENFNKENRWKKRGIALMPVKFSIDFFFSYHAMISIYAEDGTVAITTGGIEMGQGLNTKIAQVCAYSFGIGLDMVKIKPTSNLTAPNDGMSGASITSDSCCYAVLKCCEIMNERLAPIKEKLDNPTWQKLISEANVANVDLNVSYMNSILKQEIAGYDVFAASVSEVEVDLLTGKHIIIRTDILEDVGESLSPYIDIGQIEGAFVMGLGYMLSERIFYDPLTGKNLANRTWNYWPMGAKDIPADFRVNIMRENPNPTGVLRAKSTGEPPLCLAFATVCAIRHALKAARAEIGQEKEWFNIDQPCSPEKIFLAANTSVDHLTI